MPRRLHASLIATAALCAAGAAWAQPDSTVELARGLYEKGQRQYALGHFGEARQLFESAYQAKAAPALLFNIAQCHRKLGDLREAAALYRSFLGARSASNQLAQLHQQGTVSPGDDARLRSEADSKRSRATVLYVVSAVVAT